MHKVFISYHHDNDQWAKDELQQWAEQHDLFIDMSVDTSDIEDSLSPENIRQIIRDDYLRDSTVTIVLVGTETKGRKHVDWEIYSSMYDGVVNKKSGIFVIQLPSTNSTFLRAAHEVEKTLVYPDITSWYGIDKWEEYKQCCPDLPDRIIDNLVAPEAKVSVTTWDRVKGSPNNLKTLINTAFDDRGFCEYDLSRPMRSSNAPTKPSI